MDSWSASNGNRENVPSFVQSSIQTCTSTQLIMHLTQLVDNGLTRDVLMDFTVICQLAENLILKCGWSHFNTEASTYMSMSK